MYVCMYEAAPDRHTHSTRQQVADFPIDAYVSMCVCVCVCAYIYTYIHIYICIRMYVNVYLGRPRVVDSSVLSSHVCMLIRMYICMLINVYAGAQTNMHTLVGHELYAHTYVCMSAHKCVCRSSNKHAYLGRPRVVDSPIRASDGGDAYKDSSFDVVMRQSADEDQASEGQPYGPRLRSCV
jgi:hypothetical protein